MSKLLEIEQFSLHFPGRGPLLNTQDRQLLPQPVRRECRHGCLLLLASDR